MLRVNDLRLTRHALLGAASIGVLTLATPQISLAQEGAASSGFDEIIVSAQRREQSAQDVPISLQSFDSDAIDRQSISEASDYLALTPNVSFTQDGETGSRGVNISIRGVGDVDLGEVTVANSIGYYIDELSVGSVANGVINPQLQDMERIEVLRGPQGTYFGRNSSGGALNLTTKKPTDEFFASLEGQYGSFDTWGVNGVVNLPLTEGLAARFVASYEESDGIIKNVNPNGTPSSDSEFLNLRGSIRATPRDNVTIDFSANYTDEDEGLDPTVATGVLDLDTQSIFGSDFIPVETVGVYPQNQRFTDKDAQEENLKEYLILNGRVQIDFDGFMIRSITGYVDSSSDRFADLDGIFADTLVRENHYDGNSFSQEIRIQSTGENTLDWTVGGIYAKDEIDQFNSIRSGAVGSILHPNTGLVTGLLPPIPAGFRINENNRAFETKSIAFFFDGTYHLNERVDLTAGGRYTHDKVTNNFFGTVAFEGAVPDAAGSDSFNDFSPRVALTYHWADGVSTYATVSKGYKSGGLDYIQSGAMAGVQPFLPEKLWNYEIGLKLAAYDNRLLVNAAAFYIDWKDLQIQTNFLAVPGDISSAVELTQNATGARNIGFEIDAQAMVADGFVISGGYGYIDSEFDDFPVAILAGGSQVDLTGRTLPRTPKVTWNAAAQYDTAISNSINGFARIEAFGRSSSFSDLEAVSQSILGLPQFPYRAPHFGVVNIRMGVSSGNVSLSGFVENLFEEDYYTSTSENFGLAGMRVRPNPRRYGIRLKVSTGAL
ncbi:MAG TPA: TonB-dependent receptor [Parvularculaceae bacterium]|nr:TonB-dependent receptor [Amphiplicatus sp.]MCB9956689.1 TonB-dependent receptor [Caulobacterales bacterium]HPE30424.1 TonB-dependent receptor [Parvularculaceae bacterium]